MSDTGEIDTNGEPQEVTVTATRPPALQYLRALSCIVSSKKQSVDFKDFRVVFTIKRGDVQTPNTADVRIYNLSDQTANLVSQKEFSNFKLQAGYEGNFGLIFQGTIKQFRKGREDQKNSYLDILAADGDEAYNFATAVGSLAAGYSDKDHWNFLTAAMARNGVTPGPVPAFLSTKASVRGRVFSGMARDYLRKFAVDQECTWSIQDGQMTLIPLTSYLPGTTVPVISPQTGLIGVPEQTLNGIYIRTLLNPRLKIGQLIQLESTVNKARLNTTLSEDQQRDNTNLGLVDPAFHGVRTFGAGDGSGTYYVMSVEHSGDTRGNPWYTDLVCLAADLTLIPNSVVPRLTDSAPADVIKIGG